MERAISYINIMPDSQEGIEFFVSKVLSEVEIREALPLLAKLTAMEKIIEGIRDGLKDQVLDEANLEGEKTFMINGTRYEKRTRSTYYYNHCAQHEQMKEQLKRLEKIMQTIDAPIADADTGEIIEPARRSFTDYIAVTLKKQ